MKRSIALFAAAGLALSAFAQPQPEQKAPEKKAEQTPQIAPQAEKTLRAMTEFFSKVKSASVDISQFIQVQMQGMKQEMPSEFSFAVQRPNHYALVLKTGMMGSTIICDGT